MRITLKNFRCYENSVFDFGCKGLCLLSGPSGAGKCLAKDTMVLMLNGTVKKVQDIKIGDKIMGDDSKGRDIISVCKGEDVMYKIIPSKGKEYCVNSHHILTLKGVKPVIYEKFNKYVVRYMENSILKFCKFNCKKEADFFYLNLNQNPINDISIKDYLKLSKKNKRLNYTYHVGVEFKETELINCPYLLGVNIMSPLDCQRLYNSDIPREYIINSRENRLKLLAGIIDRSSIIIYSIVMIDHYNKKLIEDIEYLVLSLGFMAVYKKKDDMHSLKIYGDIEEIPCKIKKLVNIQSATVHSFKVKNIGVGEYYGFEINGNGRFLLGDFKVTHNTSILLGIYFSLFGTGSKLIMYGKTTCSVMIEFDDMVIVRTKKPCRLVVNDIYEDDSAQEIINKKFGSTFQITSYVSQNAGDSFILMSPIEKLGFLEKFSFQDTNIISIKAKCKRIINEKYELLLQSTTQLEMFLEMFNDIKKPEKVEFPLKCSIKNREKLLKNKKINKRNTEICISKCTIKLKELEKELQSLLVLKVKTESKQEYINNITEKNGILIKELDGLKYIGDDELKKLENNLSLLLSLKDLINLKKNQEKDVKTLYDMKNEETNIIVNKIEKIRLHLIKEDNVEEIEKNIQEYKQIVIDLETLKILEDEFYSIKVSEEELIKLEKLLECSRNKLDINKNLLHKLEIQKEVLECPSCNVNLKFKDNKLHVFTDKIEYNNFEDKIKDLEKETNKINKDISKYENSIHSIKSLLKRYKELEVKIFKKKEEYEDYENLPDLLHVKKELKELKENIIVLKDFQSQLNILENLLNNNIFSNTVNTFEKNVKKQSLRILDISLNTEEIEEIEEINNNENYDEEKLRNCIIIEKQKMIRLNTIKNDIIKYEIEKKDLEYNLKKYNENHINIYKEIQDISILELNKQKYEEELLNLHQIQIEHNTNIDDINKYNEYKKLLETYNTWKDKVENIKKEEIEKRKEYGAALILKEKILEAESILMINVITSINTHSQVFLDSFFIDNPISVKLVTFKDSKKGKNITRKPQINLQIEYKGMEADINMLSGGEISRVILAFSLALGEMFNTPMMLLDECTSSLDQELTSSVIEGIRENFTGKLVLIIAHQTIKGSYDNVVEI